MTKTWTFYQSHCQQHCNEIEVIPSGLAAGYPSIINFAAIPSRIAKFKKHFTLLIDAPYPNHFYIQFLDFVNLQGEHSSNGIQGALTSISFM